MHNSTITNKNSKEVLLGLELLRFFSALVILIWHYQHFASLPQVENFDSQNQPFYDSLSIFYTSGAKAVYLFWALSGYIFFYNYFQSVAECKLKPFTFFRDRFSRLYPLHLGTLIIVSFLQLSYFQKEQTFFIYEYNDPYHFLLNILFASYWGFEKGYSYNGPIWSVSVEILVYFIFFYTTFKLSNRDNIIMTSTALVIFYIFNLDELFLCFFFFYLGGILCKIIETRKKHHIFTLIIAFLLLKLLETNKLGFTTINFGYQNLFGDGLICLLLLLSFLKLGPVLKPIGSFVSAMGNLTYSMYLCHFPIQLIIVLLFVKLEKIIPYERPWLLLCFITITVIVSYCVYEFFEKPAKYYLRRKMRPIWKK